MTKRTELQHRILETREVAMSWVANRLFSLKRGGIDGFLKRKILKDARGDEKGAVGTK